jgi:hypothetical protein
MPGDPAQAAPGPYPTAAVGIADASGATTTTTAVYDAPQGAYVAQQPVAAPPPAPPAAAPVYVQQPRQTTVYVQAPAPGYVAPTVYYSRPVYYYRPTYYTYAPYYYYRPGVAVIVR